MTLQNLLAIRRLQAHTTDKAALRKLLDAARTDLAQGHWPAAARSMLVFARHLPRHPAYAWRRLGTPLRLVRRVLRRRAAAA